MYKSISIHRTNHVVRPPLQQALCPILIETHGRWNPSSQEFCGPIGEDRVLKRRDTGKKKKKEEEETLGFAFSPPMRTEERSEVDIARTWPSTSKQECSDQKTTC